MSGWRLSMNMETHNAIVEKSKAFAVRIVNARKYLVGEKKEWQMSDQLLRSGTSIKANVAEAQYAQSKADFICKMHIALKEANECKSWLELLYETDYINEPTYKSIVSDVVEIIKILTAIIVKAKS